MKKLLLILAMLLLARPSHAQVIELIKAAIEAAIKAMDLQVQKIQNETLLLQNAVKTAENNLSKTKLGEIADLSEQQKDLYANYFKEFTEVRPVIANSKEVTASIALQAQIVSESKKYSALFNADNHFTANELNYINKVFAGIANESIKNLNQINSMLVLAATSMTDQQRMAIIKAASKKLEENYADLRAFNSQNIQLSLQRAKDENDITTLKKLYGL